MSLEIGTRIPISDMKLPWYIISNENFLNLYSTKNMSRKKILNATPRGFSYARAQQLLLFVVSACLFVARKPFVRCCNCAISCRPKKKKKIRCHVPFAIFLSERIGLLRVLLRGLRVHKPIWALWHASV